MVKWSAEFTVPAKGAVGINVEDAGHVLTMVHSVAPPREVGGDGCFFIRLYSDDADSRHKLFRQLMGRAIRVTVETGSRLIVTPAARRPAPPCHHETGMPAAAPEPKLD